MGVISWRDVESETGEACSECVPSVLVEVRLSIEEEGESWAATEGLIWEAIRGGFEGFESGREKNEKDIFEEVLRLREEQEEEDGNGEEDKDDKEDDDNDNEEVGDNVNDGESSVSESVIYSGRKLDEESSMHRHTDREKS